ncbi:MAG TPA: class I SAM-dependent methyltransferase [Usitatibacter sp.]|nr:class I SAM-dependent methyltransferase [Usitatibacter sp.]
MSKKTTTLTEELYEYLLAHSLREHPVLRELREATAGIPHAVMQIAPEQGQFMALLVRLLGARRTIEVGVFTGYSSLAVALALPPEGKIVACDVSAEWTAMAREFWIKAGVASKIDLRLAPALETLDSLLASQGENRYDFAFIDADKGNYLAYYERCMRLVRPGGLIAVDNTLWSGYVAEPSRQDEDTRAIRAFNDQLHGDRRIELSMLPIADGLTLALKK